MATISKLVPGQVVYSIERQKMGNTTMSRNALYPVRIIEIDPEGKFVVASWNGNPARTYRQRQVTKWRVSKPEPKGSILGLRDY
jgi:hypothetical protein